MRPFAGTPVVAGGLDAACGTLGAGVIHPGETQEQGGQAGGMSICMDTYKADPRLILGYHVVPNQWLLQGGTTGGGGVMRWVEREFADYERQMQESTGISSLDQLNLIAENVEPGSGGVVFLPYMAGERSPIWNPDAKGVFYGLIFLRPEVIWFVPAWKGLLFLCVTIWKQQKKQERRWRCCGLWEALQTPFSGHRSSPISPERRLSYLLPDTATTLGAAILAGVGVGFYKDYEEAVVLTVKETRIHEPNPKNREVYDQAYGTYRNLYDSLKNLCAGNRPAIYFSK